MRSMLMKNVFSIAFRALAFSVILSVSSIASAAITGTFVAAVDGVNSFQSVDGVSAFSDPVATPGLWHERVGVFDIASLPSPASGAYQGQNKTGGVQTHNEVVTTLTGLTMGESYDIYMVYGINTSPSSGAQDIDAGFASGNLVTLTEAAGTDTGEALAVGGTWVAYEQLIGSIAANGSGEIAVYVDATLNAERSVYNGLSYEVTPIPEPSSLMLLALGLGALVTWKRRK